MAKLDYGWERCTLTNLDKPNDKVVAYYNPKEITIEKKVPWNKHKKSKGDAPTLEFTNAEPETLSLELFFDCYETKQDVYETYVKGLRAMTLIDEAASGEKKRPPQVMLSWGKKDFLNFKGVITSLSTKYTMFLPDGTPVRASCTLNLQQAGKVAAKVPAPPRPQNNTTAGGGSSSSGGGSPTT
jgi:hypothetical protein